MGVNFGNVGNVGIRHVFDALNDPRFERIAFVDQLCDAFRIGASVIGKTLQIAGLAS